MPGRAMTGRSPAERRARNERPLKMATVVWLLAAVAAWLATVCAIWLLLAVAKRADARLHTPPCRLAELAAGGLTLTDACGLSGPGVGAIAAGVREPPLDARTTAIAAG